MYNGAPLTVVTRELAAAGKEGALNIKLDGTPQPAHIQGALPSGGPHYIIGEFFDGKSHAVYGWTTRSAPTRSTSWATSTWPRRRASPARASAASRWTGRRRGRSRSSPPVIAGRRRSNETDGCGPLRRCPATPAREPATACGGRRSIPRRWCLGPSRRAASRWSRDERRGAGGCVRQRLGLPDVPVDRGERLRRHGGGLLVQCGARQLRRDLVPLHLHQRARRCERAWQGGRRAPAERRKPHTARSRTTADWPPCAGATTPGWRAIRTARRSGTSASMRGPTPPTRSLTGGPT